MSFKFAIDRGGTFTDVYCVLPDGSEHTEKVLSVDPTRYTDAPSEGIRRILHKFSPNSKLNSETIEWIRMGTTVATNALLEHKGEPVALAITSGFRDLLQIGDQSRSDIFDLAARKPEPLYTRVVEVEERVVPLNEKCQMNLTGEVKLCSSGDKIQILQELDIEKLRADLKSVLESGIKSLAVVLIHSYIYPDHEVLVAKVARELGFEQISLSSETAPMIKATSRGLTAVADAYLTPVLTRYINGFTCDLEEPRPKVLFMQSDGGLVPAGSFIGSRAVLSGPAGGVVAFCRTCSKDIGLKVPIIGLDMGGTSTDVCRIDSSGFEHTFEATIAGVALRSPQLDIRTVAAGGGSILTYRSGLFAVGPESAGAFPGPLCYRNNGFLTVTDANLALGRIVPHLFPNVFGPNKDQPLDVNASRSAFEQMAHQINCQQKQQQQQRPLQESSDTLTWEQVAHGFLAVANETMSRPIRSITEGRGFDSSDHVLCIAGGAGPQHACALARSLGMKKVFIHRLSGILSAYGMALADLVAEKQEPVSTQLTGTTFNQLIDRLKSLAQQCSHQLTSQGVNESFIAVESYLNLRFERTDFAIMTRVTGTYEQLVDSFKQQYKREFGFVMADRNILVDDARVRTVGSTEVTDLGDEDDTSIPPPPALSLESTSMVSCYFEQTGWTQVPVYQLSSLKPGHEITGPSLIVDKNSTILVEVNCYAKITKNSNVLLTIDELLSTSTSATCKTGKENEPTSPFDPAIIEASIMAHRFMSIAEQMGRVLQRTAISTNIKERLDFSCAIFDSTGGLVSNAPHIPVHLGSMQKAVQFQLQNVQLNQGDVILSNHPVSGGSHLPDITVGL